MSEAFEMSEARDQSLQIFRGVVQTGQRAYVRTRSRGRFLTLTPSRRELIDPVVPVTARWAKANFSDFCALVRFGIQFEIRLKSGGVLYARRHQSYEDPADLVVARWQDAVISAAKLQLLQAVLTELPDRLGSHIAGLQEKIEALIEQVTRLSIGRQSIGRASSCE